MKSTLVLFCFAAFVFTACERPASTPVHPPLKMATLYWSGCFWIDIAREQGWFREAGLELTFIDTNADFIGSIPGVEAGRLDFHDFSLFDLMLHNSCEADLVMLVCTDQSNGADGIVARAGIESLGELRGKRIGIPPGTYSDYIWTTLCGREGIAEDEFIRVDSQGEKALAALAGGGVDAVIGWEPYLTEAVTHSQAHGIWDSSQLAGIPGGQPGSFLAVEVRDTGTGIPPEVLARIWEPFFTTKGEGKGTGLGLSTVRGIVANHGGFVTVMTRLGHGTAFTVYLPATETAAAGSASAAPIESRPRGEAELILVVDDEEPVRTTAAMILDRYGYQTITACDGADAIAVFASRAAEVRLLLTDLQMPTLDGVALSTTLRRLNPTLPIVAMSGADNRATNGCPEFASAFLAKPFQIDTLLAIVRRTLDEAGPPNSHAIPSESNEVN